LITILSFIFIFHYIIFIIFLHYYYYYFHFRCCQIHSFDTLLSLMFSLHLTLMAVHAFFDYWFHYMIFSFIQLSLHWLYIHYAFPFDAFIFIIIIDIGDSRWLCFHIFIIAIDIAFICHIAIYFFNYFHDYTLIFRMIFSLHYTYYCCRRFSLLSPFLLFHFHDWFILPFHIACLLTFRYFLPWSCFLRHFRHLFIFSLLLYFIALRHLFSYAGAAALLLLTLIGWHIDI